MKTHIWHGHKDHADLEQIVNLWLKAATDRGIDVRDIEYGYTTDGSWGWYSAMVKYNEIAGDRKSVV